MCAQLNSIIGVVYNEAKQKDESYRTVEEVRDSESGVKLATEMRSVFLQRSPVRLLKAAS